MKTKRLGNTNIFVTPVGMGVLTVGSTQLDLSISEGTAIVRYAVEQGISFLDTAECYRTYPQIKRALKDLAPSFSQNILKMPVITSKSLTRDYEGMRIAVEECRAVLDMDVIDIFLLHEVRQPPDFESRSGAWACLVDEKAKGHVKAIGISTHHIDTVMNAALTPGMDVLFPLINYKGMGVRKGDGAGTAEEMALAIESASKHGVGIFAMKAFGGGNLAGDYKKALDYVIGLPGVDSIMIGLGCNKDIDDAVAWAEGRLPEGFVPDVAGKHMFVDRGDCEGCGACVSRCTSKAIRLDDEGIAVIDYEACVLCGYCAYVCPTRGLIYL